MNLINLVLKNLNESVINLEDYSYYEKAPGDIEYPNVVIRNFRYRSSLGEFIGNMYISYGKTRYDIKRITIKEGKYDRYNTSSSFKWTAIVTPDKNSSNFNIRIESKDGTVQKEYKSDGDPEDIIVEIQKCKKNEKFSRHSDNYYD